MKLACVAPFRFLFFALAAFLLALSPLSAQTPALFPDNPNEFVDKLGSFMTASKRPDLEESFSVFKKMFRSGSFSDTDMKRIILVSNILNEQKLSPFPYFKNYINAVTAARTSVDTSLFNRWHGFAEKTLAGIEKGKAPVIGKFLDFSSDFMEQRAFKIGEGGSVTWKIKGGKFAFEYLDMQPLVRCTNVSLIGVRKQDSISISNTSGVYRPYEGVWQGTSGKITWAGTSLDSTVYAELTRYKVDAIKATFQCDTVRLFYALYFPGQPILGKLEHNIVVDSKGNSQYPRFESFDKTLKINKIGEGIEYVGGFRLAGSSLLGYGEASQPARVTIYNKKRQKVFYGTGPLFIIKQEQSIVAEGVDAKLFMDADSLFHPSADFRVDIPGQVINLSRGVKGSARNPFFSSFYNMNLNTDKIVWHLAKDSLEIGARAGITGTKGAEQTVEFESSNNFNQADYDKMQNIASQNPISTLYILYKEKGTVLISDSDFAHKINPKFDYSSIQTLLAQMVAEGFINYYFERHEIELRDKLTHYALASQGKKDYDAINIVSTSTGSNASLNLKTKETQIYEVKKLELSKRQRVAAIPYGRSLTLLKNRDMRFTGKLYAGLALFEGKDLKFTYDKFQVEFDSVRNLDFYLPTGEKDLKGEPIATGMNSSISYLSGVLLVDAPNNKSGKEEMGIFPSLQSKKPSYVFYDKPGTQSGVYKRDSFYFKLDPFAFNALDTYTKEQLKFKGEMSPATIFPAFKETIIVRDDDKSFGFVHKTPVAGYKTYSGKGNYTGDLDLSNKGFMGKGQLKYLTASIESEDLIFRPKQTTGTAKKFFLEEDRVNAVKLPEARGENVSVNWLPFKDSMYVESKAKAFEIFKASGYTHNGVLILTPSGLKGKGVFEWAEGKLTSKLISYGPFQASADTANLEIKALSGKDIAFDSRNVDGELDFDAQTGYFKANSEAATTTLPLDQYSTSMNEFTWNMREKTITFKADPKKPASFISIDPDRDTLTFKGKTALYDLNTNLLKIGGVEVIKSADAFIYPEKGDIEIAPGGEMKELTNAKIQCDTVSKYHTINRATVTIDGKKLYKATGYYEYNIPGFQQEVFFNNIVGERRGQGTKITKNVRTTASGDLKEDQNFHLDVTTLFKGQIILNGNQKNMRFEGFAKLQADKLPNNRWFQVYSEVDKNDPTIRVKGIKDEDDNPIVTGFNLSKENGDLYPRILLPAYARADRHILDCEGVYKYDAKTDRFTFGDSARVVGASVRGAKMVYDNRVGSLQGEGPLNIGSGLDYMKVKAVGKLETKFTPEADTAGYDVSGEFMTAMELKLPKVLFDQMLNEIKAASFDAPPAIYTTNQPFYTLALNEFITDEVARTEAIANMKANFVVLPKKDDKYAFVLGRHLVRWNTEYQSFISMEDKIPVISINGEPLGKSFTTYVEYKMPGNEDDRFYLYIRPSADLWYFFGYQGGALNVVSSSTKFNETLLAMKPKDLQTKMPDGETYEIIAANPATADAFVNRVRAGRAKE